jgi:hypothetical protein
MGGKVAYHSPNSINQTNSTKIAARWGLCYEIRHRGYNRKNPYPF